MTVRLTEHEDAEDKKAPLHQRLLDYVLEEYEVRGREMYGVRSVQLTESVQGLANKFEVNKSQIVSAFKVLIERGRIAYRDTGNNVVLGEKMDEPWEGPVSLDSKDLISIVRNALIYAGSETASGILRAHRRWRALNGLPLVL